MDSTRPETVGMNFKFAHLDEIAAMTEEQLDAVFPTEEEAEFAAEVQAQMDADAGDPTKQMYFLDVSRKSILKNEAEYIAAVTQGRPLKQVTWGHAIAVVKNEEARKRALKKTRAKGKVAKAARKANR